MRNKVILSNLGLLIVLSLLLIVSASALSAEINWNAPGSFVDRLISPGEIVVVPEEIVQKIKADYRVDVSGKTMMLTGYQLPEGWKEATQGVEKIVLTNSGSLSSDAATAINAALFEKMTGIHIQFIEMDDPMLWPKALSTLMAGDTSVDGFYMTRAMLEVPHLSAAGWIEPVNELWPQEVQNLFPADLLVGLRGYGEQSDTFYTVPHCLWARMLFYRPSWLEGAGVEVPQTWQELVPATKKVEEWAKKNVDPTAVGETYPAGDVDNLHILLGMVTYAQGKRIMQPDGRAVLDPEAWDLITSLWLEGGMSKSSLNYQWPDAPAVFAQGKAGFCDTGGVLIYQFNDPNYAAAIQGDWDATATPAWEGVGKQGLNLSGNDAWVINKFISSEKKAAVKLWLDYQRSFQYCFNELVAEGNEPALTLVYDHPFVKENVPYYELRRSSIENSIAEAFPPGFMDAMEVFKEYLGKVVMGELTPEEGREEIQSYWDKIL